jgi:hypothetical protein
MPPSLDLSIDLLWLRCRDCTCLSQKYHPVHTENFILAMKSPFSGDAAPISSSN